MLLVRRNYSAQLVNPASPSLWCSHQHAISGRELWCGVVNTRAIRHQCKRPFREMKGVQTNRGPDVTCLRLIEFLSTYTPENRTRRCYWLDFTPWMLSHWTEWAGVPTRMSYYDLYDATSYLLNAFPSLNLFKLNVTTYAWNTESQKHLFF